MTRTQIYLTAEEIRRVEKVARQTSRTKSDVIRHALDIYLGLANPAQRESAFGMWAGRKKDSVKVQRKLRSEWRS